MAPNEVKFFRANYEEDILIDDGEARLELIEDVGLGEGYFGFSAVNGGGFTGILVSVDEWEKMKNRVDSFIKKKWPGEIKYGE